MVRQTKGTPLVVLQCLFAFGREDVVYHGRAPVGRTYDRFWVLGKAAIGGIGGGVCINQGATLP